MFGILFPALGSEGFGIFAPKVCPAVHGKDVVGDHAAFLNINWGPSVRSTANWDGCILCRDTEVDWDRVAEDEELDMY